MLKFVTFSGIFLILTELFCRVVVDPAFLYSINVYNERSPNPGLKIYGLQETTHADFLFIGSSRVHATIDWETLKENYPSKTTLITGRAYMTPGVHYQALKHKLDDYPDFLKGAKVFIEYSGWGTYTEPFTQARLRVSEPTGPKDIARTQFLIPHLAITDLPSFFRESENNWKIKLQVFFEKISSLYKTKNYLNEKIRGFQNRVFSLNKKSETNAVASGGGIKNNGFKRANQEAIAIAKIHASEIENSPVITLSQLDSSTLSAFHILIKQNGGTMHLYKMPLHTIQKSVHESSKALQNQTVFLNWIASHDIKVLESSQFVFDDSDFPDTWHLRLSRRKNFTSLLMKEWKTSTL